MPPLWNSESRWGKQMRELRRKSLYPSKAPHPRTKGNIGGSEVTSPKGGGDPNPTVVLSGALSAEPLFICINIYVLIVI